MTLKVGDDASVTRMQIEASGSAPFHLLLLSQQSSVSVKRKDLQHTTKNIHLFFVRIELHVEYDLAVL
jgi:hypothetical protein